MQEEKERALVGLGAVEEAESRRRRCRCRDARRSARPRRRRVPARERRRLVKEVEAGGDSSALRQDLGRNGRRGCVAEIVQALRQERRACGVDGETDVVAHAVGGRQQAGENRGVRRQGERHLGEGALEEDRRRAPGGRSPASRARPVAVRRQAIGAQRVDRDQHDWRPPLDSPAAEGEQPDPEETAAQPSFHSRIHGREKPPATEAAGGSSNAAAWAFLVAQAEGHHARPWRLQLVDRKSHHTLRDREQRARTGP